MSITPTIAENATRQEADAFFNAYVEAALWTGTSADADGNVVPLDYLNFEVEDFTTEALAAMREDCESFLLGYGETIRTLNYDATRSQCCGEPWSNFDLAGHDFLLTRQGHGAGFWDRGLGEVGIELTNVSKAYGDTYVYVTDDETLEVE